MPNESTRPDNSHRPSASARIIRMLARPLAGVAPALVLPCLALLLWILPITPGTRTQALPTTSTGDDLATHRDEVQAEFEAELARKTTRTVDTRPPVVVFPTDRVTQAASLLRKTTQTITNNDVVAAESPSDPWASAPPESAHWEAPLPVNPQTNSIVYLVDASGSLIDTLPDVIQWLGESLDGIDRPVSFAVIFFFDGDVIEVPPAGLKRSTFSAKNEVYNWIKIDAGNVVPRGKSDLHAALRQALEYDVDELFILSDDGFGDGSNWGSDPHMVDSLVQIIDGRPITIHTVQFYYRDEAGALEAIADRFNGQYRFFRQKSPKPATVINLFGEMTRAN